MITRQEFQRKVSKAHSTRDLDHDNFKELMKHVVVVDSEDRLDIEATYNRLHQADGALSSHTKELTTDEKIKRAESNVERFEHIRDNHRKDIDEGPIVVPNSLRLELEDTLGNLRIERLLLDELREYKIRNPEL